MINRLFCSGVSKDIAILMVVLNIIQLTGVGLPGSHGRDAQLPVALVLDIEGENATIQGKVYFLLT